MNLDPACSAAQAVQLHEGTPSLNCISVSITYLPTNFLLTEYARALEALTHTLGRIFQWPDH